jgi:hypothetical protein
MMKQLSGIALAAIPLFLIAISSDAAAHKPLDSSNNNSLDAATVIPDHTVSWAIYQALQGQNADFYRFEGRQGERFYMQMTVPDLEEYGNFTPAVALNGNGLSVAGLDVGEDTVEKRLHAAETDFDSVPLAGDAILLEYKSEGPAEKFFEPFTQTSYMVRQELVIDKLPSTGTYEIVVFDKSLRQDESAKYVLAVGEREDFSALDYFTTLPAAWFETKVFFEDYAAIVIAVAAIFGVFALLPIAIFRGRIKEKLRTK